MAPGSPGFPGERDIHPPWQGSEPAAHPRGCPPEVGEPCAARARSVRTASRATRRERSNTFENLGKRIAPRRARPRRRLEVPSIERSGRRDLSRCRWSGHVRTRLAIDARGDCSPHEWTTRQACHPRLIPPEGTTSVAEGAFSTARLSVGPTRPTPPRLEWSRRIRPPSSQHPQTSSTSTIEARGL